MREFLRNLHDRNVIKVAIAYLVISWLILQLGDVIFPAMHLPDWSMTLVFGLLVLGFPLAVVLAWVFDITPDGIKSSSVRQLERDEEKGAPPTASLGVLPFPDLSAERDHAHFCDGLTDELINVLTRIPNLRVASRTSSFALKGKDIDLRAAADKLNVAHILEGGVRKSGNRIRVTAQLVEAVNETHLWSENYDRELEDIFAIQADIAGRILDALQLRFGSYDLLEPTTKDPKAYEFFLRGRGYAIVGGEDDLDRAAKLFLKAVEIDPDFTRAWIELAEIGALSAVFFQDKDRWREIVENAGKNAIRLAPERAESYLARGFSLSATGRFREAERDYKRALQLDQTLAKAHHHLARTYTHLGELRFAIDHFLEAAKHDPNDFVSPLLAAGLIKSQGDTVKHETTARMGVERAERILDDYPDNQRAYYLGACALHDLGDLEQANEWANRAHEIRPDDPATLYNLACFHARTGNIDVALDYLERSVTSRSWIENDPDLDPLRRYPRYQRFVSTLSD